MLSTRTQQSQHSKYTTCRSWGLVFFFLPLPPRSENPLGRYVQIIITSPYLLPVTYHLLSQPCVLLSRATCRWVPQGASSSGCRRGACTSRQVRSAPSGDPGHALGTCIHSLCKCASTSRWGGVNEHASPQVAAQRLQHLTITAVAPGRPHAVVAGYSPALGTSIPGISVVNKMLRSKAVLKTFPFICFLASRGVLGGFCLVF